MSQHLRCAIYTRKSSEEGLEQDFNSLHAQREACEAYVLSQRHEGWQLIKNEYDDGGISGGTMQRPALQRLLEDVKVGKVDIIVVYKVDRLTRALVDFARMVELFDQHKVSFVSVTQQFNTTTSMGRLTLNVLLSFAQFEREVTGERIRDKVKASKTKGMWLGGHTPLGYRVVDHKLVVHPPHAELVRQIFALYLSAGSVRALIIELDRMGVHRPKVPRPYEGEMVMELDEAPSSAWTRGGLQAMLANPVYIGKIRHKIDIHDGKHEAILDVELWQAVQDLTRRNNLGPRWRQRKTETSVLIGKIYDDQGERMVPSHTIKRGRRYRYYISERISRGPDQSGWRLPAKMIEDALAGQLRLILQDKLILAASVEGLKVEPHVLSQIINKSFDAAKLESNVLLTQHLLRADIRMDEVRVVIDLISLMQPASTNDTDSLSIVRSLPMRVQRRGVEMRLVLDGPNSRDQQGSPDLISAVARGRTWFDAWLNGEISGYKDIVEREGISSSYVGDLMKLAFLSPRLVEDIVNGKQPEGLLVSQLTRVEDIPLRWEDQALRYGWR